MILIDSAQQGKDFTTTSTYSLNTPIICTDTRNKIDMNTFTPSKHKQEINHEHEHEYYSREIEGNGPKNAMSIPRKGKSSKHMSTRDTKTRNTKWTYLGIIQGTHSYIKQYIVKYLRAHQ